MPTVAPLPRLDPNNIKVACELSELAFALRSWQLKPGVYKFRSVEDAARHRQEWQKSQVRSSAKAR